ncbi:MAG TPA: DUF2934 domain-containing protein [Hyphomonadaceae bacterium]|jgi:hypothetical protein|nr:DUF2934 domain-containing protein [Hyphomonadaceae bacterium]
MDSREARIRAKAHELWEEAGRPEGRHDEHWMKAAALIDADQHKSKNDKRGPGIDIAPATEGNSLGDIRPAGPAGSGR